MTPLTIMDSSECKLPVVGSAGNEAFFDINASTPGDFVHPLLFDDETWSQNASVGMAWVYFKGDPMSEPTPEHPLDMPFSPSTLFTIDLLNSTNATLQNVMPPTNSTPFWDSSAPFGHPDGDHKLTIPRFVNRSCPTNAFGLMMYRWVPPMELPTDAKYRFRLSTDDSDLLHYSGEVTIGAANDNHALELNSTSSPVGCGHAMNFNMGRILALGHASAFTFTVGGVLAVGILLVLGWICGARFLRRRRVLYEPLVQDEKGLVIQSWESKTTTTTYPSDPVAEEVE